MVTRGFVLGLVLILGTASGLDAQSAGGRRRTSRSAQSPASASSANPQPVFTGVVVSLTKSDLGIQADAGNVLSFSILRKTKFVKDGKTVSRSDLHNGDSVTIQASEDPNGHPAAITVTIGAATPPKSPQPSS